MSLLKKHHRKLKNKLKADSELKEHLASEKVQQLTIHHNREGKEQYKKNDEEEVFERQSIQISLEQEAAKEAKKISSILYVFADVKNLRVVEWKGGKRRIALNKEREVRKTHKGGYSQEKFQQHIKHIRRDTPKWIENNLSQKGVLRFPYEKIIIDTHDATFEKAIRDAVERK